MKIDIIIPTNNSNEINGFIMSFDKLERFKKHCRLIIIGNGNVHYDSILGGHSVDYEVIRDNNDYSNKIVPFAKLRSFGMIYSNCDFFMLLDGDHRFSELSDKFLMKMINELKTNKDLSILFLDRERDGKKGLSIKKDGFIWTNKGLFIKNIGIDFSIFSNLMGCGEDLLFSYLTLEKFGIPFVFNGSEIERKSKRVFKKGDKEVKDISYCKNTIDNNIYKEIRERYHQPNWCNEAIYYNTKLPTYLKRIIDARISNSSIK